jgi:MFS family permease
MRIIVAIAFFSQWSGNGLVSYYLNKVFTTIGITDPTIQASSSFSLIPPVSEMLKLNLYFSQLLINGILQIWNLFWALLASTLTDRLGRRFLFLTSACGMVLFFILQTIFSSLFAQYGSPGAAHAVIACIFLFYASYE